MMTCQELKKQGSVAIVGAGPAGATLARLLQARGFTVKVYERDTSPTARPQGGSLDLRKDAGHLAVDKAGLTEAFRSASRSEAKEFKMLDSHGQPHPAGGAGTHEEAGPEIDRFDLRQLLLDSLAPGTVEWNHAVQAVVPEADGRWRLEFKDQAAVTASLVVGADGAGSKVRSLLTSVRPISLGMTMLATVIRKDLWRDSEIAQVLGEGSVMYASNDQTIFVQRCNRDLILLYYSMVTGDDWPKDQGFGIEDTEAVLDAVKAQYASWPSEVMEMLTQVEGKFHRWPLTVMPPDCIWDTRTGLTMIGDSSHVMPPFTGKGVNLAMLDALELADSLTEKPDMDLTLAVDAFEKRMQERTRKETVECLQVGRYIYGLTPDFSSR